MLQDVATRAGGLESFSFEGLVMVGARNSHEILERVCLGFLPRILVVVRQTPTTNS